MKCPNCDGSGIVNEPIYNKSHTLIKNWAIKKCDICNGSGEYVAEPMTNEEYLRSANVNDMARCIATKLLELARHEYGIYDVVDYATIFEWLKEKHNG